LPAGIKYPIIYKYKRLIILYHFFIFMAIVNHEQLENKVLKKAALREKKRRPKMRVSGAGVKQLHRIILNKDK